MTETEMTTDMVHSHTPGPWKACGTIYEHMNCEIRSGAKGEGQGIAQVWDGPNAFKDGQLMAASPDLFAVAQMIVDAAESSGASILRTGPIYTAAKAAIARATGEA